MDSTSNPVLEPTPTTKRKHILILGAGISGLSTAYSLLTSQSQSQSEQKYQITLIASHFPTDPHSNNDWSEEKEDDGKREYTSPKAGGHWRSHATFSDEEAGIREYDGRTYKVWRKWLDGQLDGSFEDGSFGKSEGEEGKMQRREEKLGLGYRTCRYFYGPSYTGPELSFPPSSSTPAPRIWFSSLVSKYKTLDLATLREAGESIPKEAIAGFEYQTISFDPIQHLLFLYTQIQNLGCIILHSSLSTSTGLSGLMLSAKSTLKTHGIDPEIWTLINCSGLSAHHFLPQIEKGKLFPVRGQTLLVKGQARFVSTYVGGKGMKGEEMLYVVPRPGGGGTVMGGCKIVGWKGGNGGEGWDEREEKRIVEGVRGEGMDKGAVRGDDGNYTILTRTIGFRPGRKGGPRIEIEGKVEGTWVVHNYGHSGGGYQSSVGCAEKVGVLVKELEARE